MAKCFETKRKKRNDKDVAVKAPPWLTPLLIAVACVAAYFPAMGAGFLSDDFNYLYGHIASTADSAKGASFFRPLGILSLQIDSALYGENAFGYHLTNLLLHFAAAWGIAICAGRILLGKWASLIAGLLFALHPIHPEAVSWISGRFDVLCGALLSWAFATFLVSEDSNRGKRIITLAISYVLFTLACFTKEMAFAFPFVTAAFILIVPASGVRKRSLWPAAGFIMLAAFLFIIRASIIGGIGGYSGNEGASAVEMLYSVFIQPFYWLLLPLNRSLFNEVSTPVMWIVGVILLTPLVMFAFRPSWRIIAFGAAAIILSTLPVAQIGYIDQQMQSSRFLYIPSLFFAILIAVLFAGEHNSTGKAARYSTLISVIYLLTMLLVLNQNNFAWQDAGRVAGSARASAIQLVREHEGEWGDVYDKLVVYNVPDAYLGAYVFREGFETMLRHRTGDMLDGVEVQTFIEEIDRFENVGELRLVFDKRAVVWFFNDIQSVFEEITEEETLPAT